MTDELQELMRDLVRESGLTVYAIAKATGITESHLSGWMKSQKRLGPEAAEKLLSHFGKSIRLVNRRRPKHE